MSNGNIKFFDFAVNKFFMKLLKTTNTNIAKYSQDQFGFKLPSELIVHRTEKVILKLQVLSCV